VLRDDAPTDRYRVVKMTPAQFQLRDASGTTFLFTAAQDAALELAQ
jgi:hypothetical protein